MAKEESNERELTWADILLGSLLLPYLLTADYEQEYSEKADALKNEQTDKDASEDKIEKTFGDLKQQINTEKKDDCEKKFSVEKVVEKCAKEEAQKQKEAPAEEEKATEPQDVFLAEFGEVGDEDFLHNVTENNKHTEYYALSAFVRDALIDLESGTEELNWEYNPEDVSARLKLNDFIAVDDKTATLFNHTAGNVYIPVVIKKYAGENGSEYYLVVDL